MLKAFVENARKDLLGFSDEEGLRGYSKRRKDSRIEGIGFN